MVDTVARPARRLERGQRRPFGGDERPVRLVLGTLVDPAFQQLLFGRLQFLVRLGRRHAVAVGRVDAGDQLALAALAGDDGAAAAFQLLGGGGNLVETQARFAGLFVRAVTGV